MSRNSVISLGFCCLCGGVLLALTPPVRASINLKNGEQAVNDPVKPWTISNLNDTNPSVSRGTGAGTLDGAGFFTASEKITLTATARYGWSTAAAQSAATGGTLKAYLDSLDPALLNGLLNGSFGENDTSHEFRHNFSLAVKETVNNSLRHSKASEILIKIRVEKGILSISISDDGFGIRGDMDSPPGDPGGSGLESVRQRMRSIGGKCALENLDPGAGPKSSGAAKQPALRSFSEVGCSPCG